MKPYEIPQRVILGKYLKNSVLNFFSFDCELMVKLQKQLVFC